MSIADDREEFERDLRKPPHFARMLEHAGRFTSRLSKVDRNAFYDIAMNRLWERRSQIKETSDILLQWIAALTDAARTRKQWLVYYNMGGWRWVRSYRLGRDE